MTCNSSNVFFPPSFFEASSGMMSGNEQCNCSYGIFLRLECHVIMHIFASSCFERRFNNFAFSRYRKQLIPQAVLPIKFLPKRTTCAYLNPLVRYSLINFSKSYLLDDKRGFLIVVTTDHFTVFNSHLEIFFL